MAEAIGQEGAQAGIKVRQTVSNNWRRTGKHPVTAPQFYSLPQNDAG